LITALIFPTSLSLFNQSTASAAENGTFFRHAIVNFDLDLDLDLVTMNQLAKGQKLLSIQTEPTALPGPPSWSVTREAATNG